MHAKEIQIQAVASIWMGYLVLKFSSLVSNTLFGVLLFFFSSRTFGAESTVLLENAQGAPFFEINRGTSVCGHILGTHHLLTLADLPDLVLHRLKQSSIAAAEMDDAQLQVEDFIRQMPFVQGSTLKELVPPDVWQRLKELLVTDKLPEQDLDRMAVGVAGFLVIFKWIAEILPSVEPMDTALLQLARQHGIKVKALEDPMEPFKAAIALIDAVQVTGMVRNEQGAKTALLSQIRSMTTAYRNGDFDGLTVKGIPREILEGRNRDWFPKIKELLEREFPFILVGGAHLGGEHGLISMLKTAGFSVTAVMTGSDLPSRVDAYRQP